MRNAFSISAVKVIGSDLNFTRTSNNCGMKLDPSREQSFKEYLFPGLLEPWSFLCLGEGPRDEVNNARFR